MVELTSTTCTAAPRSGGRVRIGVVEHQDIAPCDHPAATFHRWRCAGVSSIRTASYAVPWTHPAHTDDGTSRFRRASWRNGGEPWTQVNGGDGRRSRSAGFPGPSPERGPEPLPDHLVPWVPSGPGLGTASWARTGFRTAVQVCGPHCRAKSERDQAQASETRGAAGSQGADGRTCWGVRRLPEGWRRRGLKR